MRLLARAGLVDDALDFQPQRPRQCLRLLFCLLLALDEKDRGGANHLAGVITLGEVATSPLLLSSIFRRIDTPTSCASALSESVPVLGFRSRASNSEREPTVKECADQDGCREHAERGTAKKPPIMMPRQSHCARPGSQRTLRRRETDSNFWFLVARPSNRHGGTGRPS